MTWSPDCEKIGRAGLVEALLVVISYGKPARSKAGIVI